MDKLWINIRHEWTYAMNGHIMEGGMNTNYGLTYAMNGQIMD